MKKNKFIDCFMLQNRRNTSVNRGDMQDVILTEIVLNRLLP